MIIDLRTRIWSSLEQLGSELANRLRLKYADRWEHLDASPAAHERAMACTQGACVFGFRSELLGAAVPNELVADFVAKDPRRRLGFAGIDPIAPDAPEQLEKAIDLGLVGATVSPAAQGFHPLHSSAMRIYERCSETGLPLVIANDLPLTTSCVMEFARPGIYDEVARSLPDLRIVIGDFGQPYIAETLALTGKHANVFADVSSLVSRRWELYNALLMASQADVIHKILFGSGFPFESPTHSIEALYSINGYSHGTQLPAVPRPLLRAIVERDSLKAIGIEHEIGRTPPSSEELTDEDDLPGERSALNASMAPGDGLSAAENS